MIIEATRLQHGRGGKSRPSPPPGDTIKKNFAISGAFLLLILHIWGPLCYVFLIFGDLFTMGGLFAIFTSWWGPFFGVCPPPPPTKISAGAHDCKEGSTACSPEIFLCDRNFVSSGHVLLRFCLKNDKNNDKL